MKERPILFSAPMVRAILEGRKTKTRRIVKPQPFDDPKWGLTWEPKGHAANKPSYCERNVNWNPITKAFQNFYGDKISPYGKPGDRLWCKETWSCAVIKGERKGIAYKASWGDDDSWFSENCGNYEQWSMLWNKHQDKWRPSIFMPRWASRINLEITGVRVERLQAISDEDAEAEGVETCHCTEGCDVCAKSFVESYQELWESINGKGSWSANPWVWVINFKRI